MDGPEPTLVLPTANGGKELALTNAALRTDDGFTLFTSLSVSRQSNMHDALKSGAI